MLTLKHPAPHSTGEPWGENDYEVHDSEGIVGRIVLTAALFTAGPNKSWFWSVTSNVPNETADRGNAATREEAMQAFKARWLVVSANERPRLP